MGAEAWELGPRLARVRAFENGRVFDAGEDRVRVGERGLEVPDSLELPWMGGSVVPAVGTGGSFIDELIAFTLGPSGFGHQLFGRASRRIPSFAAIIRSLGDLAEPAAGLGGVNPVRIHGRTLHVVDLPSAEVRTFDLPIFPASVCGADERPLLCPNQNSDLTHSFILCGNALARDRTCMNDAIGHFAGCVRDQLTLAAVVSKSSIGLIGLAALG